MTMPSLYCSFKLSRLVGVFLIVLLFFSCAQSDKNTPRSTDKPNIIYILADDLGYGELGSYGQQKIETPNIDSLALSGMKFTQHYAGSAVCAPSRYMLMTGKHPGHAYVRGNGDRPGGSVWDFDDLRKHPEWEGNIAIPDSTVTVAGRLQEVGYQTAAIGKWGLGGPGSTGLPNDHDFDFFFGYLGQRFAHTYYPIYVWKNKERVFLDNEPVNPHTQLGDSLDPYDPDSYTRFQDQPDYAPEIMLDEAISFIDRSQQSPFFLYYPTTIPHVSLQAPQRWVDYYHKKFGDEKPYTGDEGYAPVRYPKATYAAMISYLDEQVGTLIQKLKDMGEYENTLIIFTSDNGPTYNGGTQGSFFNSAGPFKESYGWAKGFLHEGGIRVPMIASWPGVIEAGSQTDHLSVFWDVMPTLTEIAGIEAADDIDGISFMPTLKGNPSQQKSHDYLYWEFPSYGGQQAVRIGQWKGIRKVIKKSGNMDIELYNLKNDIREQHDVADQHPDIVAKIERIMHREHVTPAVDAFRMEALKQER